MAKFVSNESVRLMAAVQQLFGDGQLSGLYRLLAFIVMKIRDNVTVKRQGKSVFILT